MNKYFRFVLFLFTISFVVYLVATAQRPFGLEVNDQRFFNLTPPSWIRQ